MMNREQAKAELKSHLGDYLRDVHGIESLKKNFNCLNPDHNDEHPSMSFDEKRARVHCFACDATYDIIDLIKNDNNLNDKEAFEFGYKLYNIDISNTTSKPKSVLHDLNQSKQEQQQDLKDYFKQCKERINQTDYPKLRGLTKQTVDEFGLGFDPSFNRGIGKDRWQALIIPTGPSSYVARNTDLNASHDNRIRKSGSSSIFNIEALNKDEPVFVVEGEIDALSIIEAGGTALALGSVVNAHKLLDYLDTHPEKSSRCFLLISLDNDKQGEEASEKLIDALNERKIKAKQVNISGSYKDPNAALVADKLSFRSAIRDAIGQKEESEKEELNSYLKTSASESMQEFLEAIKAGRKTSPVSTGFSSLDSALGRGLHSGLYVIGAIPSLGKTAFVLQIADNIASGNPNSASRDVLIFSLEMSKHELMARSISRETFKIVTQENLAISAKTTYEILDGDMYERYSEDELDLIEKAESRYKEYGKHIFILEGQGDLGIVQIREFIEKHIQLTGRLPVIVIDYLQLLAPYDSRASDKQNVDKAILELKRISRDFNTVILVISSFNRTNYNTSPTLSSFKESGSVEYSCDVLIGLFFNGLGEDGFNIDEARLKNPRDIILKIIKNRNGEAGKMLRFSFDAAHNFFKDESEELNSKWNLSCSSSDF